MKPSMKFVLVLAVAIGLAGYEAAAKPGDLLRTFLNPTPDVDDYFGYSVGAVGNNVLVGAWQDNAGATNAGAAYLFDGIPEPASAGFLLLGLPWLIRRRSSRTHSEQTLRRGRPATLTLLALGACLPLCRRRSRQALAMIRRRRRQTEEL
jgi:hypothetical protein